MIDMFYLPPVVGVLGLIVALVLYRLILKRPAGDAKVTGIADQIHLGAMVFMRREYRMLAMFSAVLLAVILFSPLGVHTALAIVEIGLQQRRRFPSIHAGIVEVELGHDRSNKTPTHY